MVALIPARAGPLGVFSATPFYTLSRLSYGMYLNHLAILRWITPSMSRAAERLTGTTAAAASVALIATITCSVLFSAVLFVAVEQPFLGLREKLVGRRSLAGAPAAASIELPAAPAGSGSTVPAVAAERAPAAVPTATMQAESHQVQPDETSPKG
jgi:peptidoglycan/LPS O-acetylase OafA/YrhL